MPTYVSIVNWSGDSRVTPVVIRAAMQERAHTLRSGGLHSLVFLPDEGECAAVMVATCADATAVTRLARAIVPGSTVDVDSMRFDDDQDKPARLVKTVAPPPLHDGRPAAPRALRPVVAGSR